MADDSVPPVFISRSIQGALLWVELAFCIGFVGFRTFIQYQHNKKLFSNDYVILFALFCHVGSAIISQLMIPPMYELEALKSILAVGGIPPANAQDRAMLYLKYQFAVLITLWTTLWSVKLSLLLFFWRLFDSLQTRMRIFWYIMLFVTASTYIITIFMQLFACGAPSTFFKFGPEGCSSQRDIYLSNLVFLFSAGSDIAVDALLLLIPFPLLWKLQVNQRRKIILATIFLLPLLPITFGILRLVFCNPTTGSVNVIKFTFYHMLENTAAIITACLPSMRLFFFLNKTGNKTRSSEPYAGGYRVGNGYSISRARAMFSGTMSRNDTKGVIPLENMDEGRDTETPRRDSDESQSRILHKGAMVTREYSVTAPSNESDVENCKRGW
ncbi:hypothetical protein BU23DRAFT_604310 [Bimuria novae-zelandiae CBS 107.79]|uniref:Rhodopsin domain-containing protein n=1 Tax=Bimuria novae-zelandiae CBS 107.79 TaxID=1447943 RepID=A0A6A5UKQ0_9PLEO|nr:hypothetical protein BU23DRAFT_604310 [Bimuria novae-zelandiae CBS 107.79]